MLNFKKDFSTRLIIILLAVILPTNNIYGIDLSNKSHLRKDLDFNKQETNPRYLATMLAAAIQKSISEGNGGDTWREVLIPVIDKYNLSDLLEEIEKQEIHAEKDPKTNIWKVYHEKSNTEILVLPEGQPGPSDVVLAAKKAGTKQIVAKVAKEGLIVFTVLIVSAFTSKGLGIDYIYFLPLPILVVFRKSLTSAIFNLVKQVKSRFYSEAEEVRTVIKEAAILKKPLELEGDLREDIEKDLDRFIDRYEQPLSLIDRITQPLPIGLTDKSMAVSFAHKGSALEGVAITENKIFVSPERFVKKRLHNRENKEIWEVIAIQEADKDKKKFEVKLLLINIRSGEESEAVFSSKMETCIVLKENETQLSSDTIDFEIELTKLATIKDYYVDRITSPKKALTESECSELRESLKSINSRLEEIQIAYLCHEHGKSIDLLKPPSLEDFTGSIIQDTRYASPSARYPHIDTKFEKDAVELIEILYSFRVHNALSLDELDIISESIKTRLLQIEEVFEKERLLLAESKTLDYHVKRAERELDNMKNSLTLEKKTQKIKKIKDEIADIRKNIKQLKRKIQDIDKDIKALRVEDVKAGSLSFSLGHRSGETLRQENTRLEKWLKELEAKSKNIKQSEEKLLDIEDIRLSLMLGDMINLRSGLFSKIPKKAGLKSVMVSGDRVLVSFKGQVKDKEYSLFKISESLLAESREDPQEIILDFLSYYRDIKLNGHFNKVYERYLAYINLRRSGMIFHAPDIETLFSHESKTISDSDKRIKLAEEFDIRIKAKFDGLSIPEFQKKCTETQNDIHRMESELRDAQEQLKQREIDYFIAVDNNLDTKKSLLAIDKSDKEIGKLIPTIELLKAELKQNERKWKESQDLIARYLDLNALKDIKQIAKLDNMVGRINEYLLTIETKNLRDIVFYNDTELISLEKSIDELYSKKKNLEDQEEIAIIEDQIKQLFSRREEYIQKKIDICEAYLDELSNKLDDEYIRYDSPENIEFIEKNILQLNELIELCKTYQKGYYSKDARITFMQKTRSNKEFIIIPLILYAGSNIFMFQGESMSYDTGINLEPAADKAIQVMGKSWDYAKNTSNDARDEMLLQVSKLRSLLPIPAIFNISLGLESEGNGMGVFSQKGYVPGVSPILEEGKLDTIFTFSPALNTKTTYWKTGNYDDLKKKKFFSSGKEFEEDDIRLGNIIDTVEVTIPIFNRKPIFGKNKLTIALPYNSRIEEEGINFLNKNIDYKIERQPKGNVLILEGNFTKGDVLYFSLTLHDKTFFSIEPSQEFISHYTQSSYVSWPQEALAFIRDIKGDPALSPYEKAMKCRDFSAYLVKYDRSKETSKFYRHNKANLVEAAISLGKGDCDIINTVNMCLLRAVGIPARLAVGYISSNDTASDDTSFVLGKDGHGWCEFYEEGKGWQISDASYGESMGSDSFSEFDAEELLDTQYEPQDMKKEIESQDSSSFIREFIRENAAGIFLNLNISSEVMLLYSNPLNEIINLMLKNNQFDEALNFMSSLVDSLSQENIIVNYNDLINIFDVLSGDIRKIAEEKHLSADDPSVELFENITKLVYRKLRNGKVIKKEDFLPGPTQPDLVPLQIGSAPSIKQKYPWIDFEINPSVKEGDQFLQIVERLEAFLRKCDRKGGYSRAIDKIIILNDIDIVINGEQPVSLSANCTAERFAEEWIWQLFEDIGGKFYDQLSLVEKESWSGPMDIVEETLGVDLMDLEMEIALFKSDFQSFLLNGNLAGKYKGKKEVEKFIKKTLGGLSSDDILQKIGIDVSQRKIGGGISQAVAAQSEREALVQSPSGFKQKYPWVEIVDEGNIFKEDTKVAQELDRLFEEMVKYRLDIKLINKVTIGPHFGFAFTLYGIESDAAVVYYGDSKLESIKTIAALMAYHAFCFKINAFERDKYLRVVKSENTEDFIDDYVIIVTEGPKKLRQKYKDFTQFAGIMQFMQDQIFYKPMDDWENNFIPKKSLNEIEKERNFKFTWNIQDPFRQSRHIFKKIEKALQYIEEKYPELFDRVSKIEVMPPKSRHQRFKYPEAINFKIIYADGSTHETDEISTNRVLLGLIAAFQGISRYSLNNINKLKQAYPEVFSPGMDLSFISEDIFEYLEKDFYLGLLKNKAPQHWQKYASSVGFVFGSVTCQTGYDFIFSVSGLVSHDLSRESKDMYMRLATADAPGFTPGIDFQLDYYAMLTTGDVDRVFCKNNPEARRQFFIEHVFGENFDKQDLRLAVDQKKIEEPSQPIDEVEINKLMISLIEMYKPYFNDGAMRKSMLRGLEEFVTDPDFLVFAERGLIEQTPEEYKGETISYIKDIMSKIARRYRVENRDILKRIHLYTSFFTRTKEEEIQIEALRYLLADDIDYKEVVDINTKAEGTVWPFFDIVDFASFAAGVGSMKAQLDSLYSLSPQIVFGFHKWALGQLSEIRKHPELFKDPSNMYLEAYNPLLLNVETEFVERIIKMGDTGRIEINYKKFLSDYKYKLKNLNKERIDVPLSVFNLDAFYFAQGAKNIIKLAHTLPKWQKNKASESLFIEAMEALQRSPAPEEAAFYGTMALNLGGEAFDGKRQSEAINLILGILEKTDAKTFSVLVESIISQGDIPTLILLTNMITSGKYGDLLKGDLLKEIFRKFIANWGYLSEIQQSDFEQIVQRGIENLDGFGLSPSEKTLINFELLDMSITSNSFKLKFGLSPMELLEGIDFAYLSADLKKDVANRIIGLQRDVYKNIVSLKEFLGLEESEERVQELKTLRFNLIKKILPIVKESKYGKFNIKIIQEEMGFTEEELKSLGLERESHLIPLDSVSRDLKTSL